MHPSLRPQSRFLFSQSSCSNNSRDWFPPNMVSFTPPGAPYQGTIPLPTNMPILHLPELSGYPIDLLAIINPYATAQLLQVQLSPDATIHIHDSQDIHLGNILLTDPSRLYTALEIVQYLSSFARSRIPQPDSRFIPPGHLSPPENVWHPASHSAFQSPRHNTFSRSMFPYSGERTTLSAWQNTAGFVTGADVLLGRTRVWGFQQDPRTFDWVLYVDAPVI
ncbi:hypothetical protein C8J56DRAFT_1172007 [Mycena floridula]|nr:hypothetical protein C8J56DRAFT_1172007 [Mycena floridula]